MSMQTATITVISINKTKAAITRAIDEKLAYLESQGFDIVKHTIVRMIEGLGTRWNVKVQIYYVKP